ncbi:MAG TPA: ferrochelatase, partial [Candidatus Polarisedimenticolia bacterium]|nr:ferrochelatase [Candidatus Polarisedimenticolia bacterium]
MSGPVDAVLLIAFGGPTAPEEIRPFLDHVLRGRPVPADRYEEVVRHYQDVGGSSPLLALTRRQAAALEAELARGGDPLPVFVGMRHWHPFIAETLQDMAGRKLRRAAGIVLAPHASPVSRQAYAQAVAEGRAALGERAPEVVSGRDWPEDPLFLEALATRLDEARRSLPGERGHRAPVLFTAHSIPLPMSEGSGYAASLRRTAEGVARAASADRWRLVYQSRSGSPGEPWLEPDILEALAEEKAKGATDVIVAPIGFVSDHVEVLYDLDIAARRRARELGLGFARA